MQTPMMNPAEMRNHQTFTALMWALSRPGQIQRLPDGGQAALLAIADALIDLETSYYTPDPELNRLLARTGARPQTSDSARYQFYPSLDAADLETLQHAPVGSYTYPDEAATLVIGCTFTAGIQLHLSGPGINGSTSITLGALPASLWTLREQTMRYPLGWDLFLVADDAVIGLPRTTVVAIE